MGNYKNIDLKPKNSGERELKNLFMEKTCGYGYGKKKSC